MWEGVVYPVEEEASDGVGDNSCRVNGSTAHGVPLSSVRKDPPRHNDCFSGSVGIGLKHLAHTLLIANSSGDLCEYCGAGCKRHSRHRILVPFSHPPAHTSHLTTFVKKF